MHLLTNQPFCRSTNYNIPHTLPSIFTMDPLSQKLTSILSSSYTDADIRDALQALDRRLTHNSPDSRRQLQIIIQDDVIQTNAAIVSEFSKIAEVCLKTEERKRE